MGASLFFEKKKLRNERDTYLKTNTLTTLLFNVLLRIITAFLRTMITSFFLCNSKKTSLNAYININYLPMNNNYTIRIINSYDSLHVPPITYLIIIFYNQINNTIDKL